MMILGWVWLRAVILGRESKISVWVFLPLLQHLLLYLFFFSFFFFQFLVDYLYEFVYGFDEFGSRFRKILMICGVSVMILGWVFQCIWIVFGLGLLVGLSWFWVGFSICFFVDFGLIFCARLGGYSGVPVVEKKELKNRLHGEQVTMYICTVTVHFARYHVYF